MERQLATGPRVDQLTQFVAVSGPRVEQREDEQLRGALLQLTVECPRVDICHRQIVCRQISRVNPGSIRGGKPSSCRKRLRDPVPTGEGWSHQPRHCLWRYAKTGWRPRGSGSDRQAHLLEEGDVSRIALEALQEKVAFHLGEPAVALRVGPLQPFEGAVGFAAERVYLGDLVGGIRPVFRDELGKGRVRFLLTTQRVVGQGQSIQPP